MSDLRELYQAVILDHNKKPRNFGVPDIANRSAAGDNPLCGDKLVVYLMVEDGDIKDVAFEGSGCAISKASASLMTEAIKGKSITEAERLFESFHSLVTEASGAAAQADRLGKLEVFTGVREFPMRVKCATLSWHTMRAALRGSGETASTE